MKEVLKLALEALMDNEHYVAENERHAYVVLYNEVIEKCKAALAQTAQESDHGDELTIAYMSGVHRGKALAAQQCLDCDSNNIGIPATYDSLIGSVKTPQQRPWESIETAPKDGTDVLVMYVHIDTQVVHNGFWIGTDDTDNESDIGWWSYEYSEVSRIKLDDWMTPTHWLPLPELKEKNA